MSKETAIEWLIGELNGYDEDCEIFQIAKAMEREQMAESFCEGSKLLECPNELSALFEFELYYLETYKGGEQ